jgi:hypothetical protein
MRAIFNAHILPRIDNGELIPTVLSDGIPSPNAGQRAGTRSQMVAYRDRQGRKIAIVHRYLRPDQTLGGSGKPDPKMVLHGNVRYTI